MIAAGQINHDSTRLCMHPLLTSIVVNRALFDPFETLHAFSHVDLAGIQQLDVEREKRQDRERGARRFGGISALSTSSD
jgi:hypothetical protein